jgi:hypothetical protein
MPYLCGCSLGRLPGCPTPFRSRWRGLCRGLLFRCTLLRLLNMILLLCVRSRLLRLLRLLFLLHRLSCIM